MKYICQEIGLPDASQDKVNISKEDVKQAIKIHHVQAIKISMKGEKLRLLGQSDLREKYTHMTSEHAAEHRLTGTQANRANRLEEKEQ